MQLTNYNDIFEYIIRQETAYKLPVPLNGGWNWSMKEHLELSYLYKHSQLKTGKDDFKPVKNIVKPILNLQYRTEDIEVKDVQLYVDNPDKYHLSFLVKRYHDDVFTKENDMDTYFDELNVQRIDMGGGLSKKLYMPRPEVVDLQSLAFCDQTDILSGPIGIKHFYSPDQLLDMETNGWGDTKNGATATLDEVILLSREEKKDDKNGAQSKTPGKYIEVYEVHGNLPKKFANKGDDLGKYESQIYIVCFYTKPSSTEKNGIILYTAPEKESPFKLIKRDAVYGRALGFGGVEELFEDQVWTNYDMIRKQDMLDAASKTILGATGPDSTNIAKRTDVKGMDNLEIVDLGQGSDLKQIDTFPRNMRLFDQSINEWNEHAKSMGAAQDPIQGIQPASGTPFASLQAQIQQGMGLHSYRRLQYAKHLEEIYKDWIIPHIAKKICEGTKFLSELSLDELQYVGACIVRNETNKYIKERVLNGEVVAQQEIDAYSQQVASEFSKKGNKHFVEILKGEFKNVELGVKVSIAGKSKDLAGMVDKLTKVFQAIIANPYILQSPPIAKLFNKIIEASGLDPIDLSQLNIPPMPARRMTETIDYADLALPPNEAQTEMLKLAGIQPPQQAPMTH